MASNAGWDKTVPSGTSSIAQGDDDIRSTKSSMQAWWEQEHYATDGSTNSAGVHKLGSARVYMGASPSALSNPTGDNNGRLMHTSSTNGLWIADGSNSTWTLVTNSITLGAAQTWTALQGFSSGISASDISVSGSFTGVLSGSTFTHLASISAGGQLLFPIAVTGARPGDFCLVSTTSARGAAGGPPRFHSQVTVNDVVEVLVIGPVSSTWSLPSNQTFSALVFGNPDRA